MAGNKSQHLQTLLIFTTPLARGLTICLFGMLFIFENAFAQKSPTQIRELYENAETYMYDGRLSVALDMINQVIREREDYAEAYLLRARIHDRMDNLKDANTDYSIVLYLQTDIVDARFQRGVNYYKLKRYQDALIDFHCLLKDSSQSTTTVYFKGRNDQAGFSTSSVTTLQSDMKADLFNYLGLIHLALENADSAAYYLNMAIQRKPNEADFYANRALFYEKQQDTAAAITDYQRALSYQSDHYASLSNLNKLSQAGQYDMLVAKAYDLAVEEQGSYQAYFNRAINLQANGQHRLAVRDFDRAISLAGKNDEALLLRGYSKERIRDLKGALSDYTAALRANPLLGKAYSNRGNVYYKLKRYPQAIADYNRAIEFYPEEAKLFYNRGLALYLSGQHTDGCIDLRIALKKGFQAARGPISSYCQ